MTDPPALGHKESVALALQASPAPARVQADTPQFAEIYDIYFDFVYRSARRLGVAERAVDDAVQDVFLVVHRRLDDFEGRSSVKTWLYGITRRVAKDHRRRSERKEQGMVPADHLEAVGHSPQEDAARAEAARVLHEILDGFDAERREIFVLAEMEQMTAPEIAEALSLNLNTVYSRLRKARADFESAVQRHLARQKETR